MPAKVYSAAVIGLDAQPVEVEADLLAGLFSFGIVGLPGKAVSEAKERVSSAIKNSSMTPPHQSRKRLVVNLAPADLKKEGPSYDLAIAIAYLLALGEIKVGSLKKSLFVGELSLDGKLRPISGILPIAIMAKEKGFERLFMPKDNFSEADLACRLTGAKNSLKVMPIDSLRQLANYFGGLGEIDFKPVLEKKIKTKSESDFDMAYVKGQEQAKRALEVAGAGGHNILMHGPPGAGKTLLARAFSGILPFLTKKEILEVTKIYSVAGKLKDKQFLVIDRPFRAPHHSASLVSMVGGGSLPRPGEISLAHRGVLFMDEFPEFPRHLLESLRQPLEDGIIAVSRASASLIFPARFILVGAMNPCPCGKFGDNKEICVCSPNQVSKYQRKLSGPLLDRIDLHIEVPKIGYVKLAAEKTAEPSKEIRKRIKKARQIQASRFKNEAIMTNSEMGLKEIKKYCQVDSSSRSLLRQAMDKFDLSARSYHRILKISRTIADLAGQQDIEAAHIAEAIQYRARQGKF